MNKNVSFIKGKEYISSYGFFKKGRFSPIYMIRDNVEFFIKNVIQEINGDTYSQMDYERQLKDVERIKYFLISNKGAYYKDYGNYDNPFDLINYITENNYTLEKFSKFEKFENYVVFSGNLKEESCVFRYVVYDLKIIEKLEILYNAIKE